MTPALAAVGCSVKLGALDVVLVLKLESSDVAAA
jgi:hypothetical protein